MSGTAEQDDGDGKDTQGAVANSMSEGRFDLIVGGVLRTYRRWEDIPAVFDHVVRFEPALPPAPHTPEQHAEASLWNARLQELMEIERARGNQDR